jgi:hypothetical protein
MVGARQPGIRTGANCFTWNPVQNEIG